MGFSIVLYIILFLAFLLITAWVYSKIHAISFRWTLENYWQDLLLVFTLFVIVMLIMFPPGGAR